MKRLVVLSGLLGRGASAWVGSRCTGCLRCFHRVFGCHFRDYRRQHHQGRGHAEILAQRAVHVMAVRAALVGKVQGRVQELHPQQAAGYEQN